jgi:hypothetical protein
MTDKPFPREENMSDLVGSRAYSEGVQWRVFKDLDGEMPGINVLIVTDTSWTMVTAADFKAMATRILSQL